MNKILLILLLTSCAVSKEPNCFKRAIVLSERSRIRTLEMEYAYIKANYPRSQLRVQKVEYYKNKTYDVLTLVPYKGRTLVKIYFEVSSVYDEQFK